MVISDMATTQTDKHRNQVENSVRSLIRSIGDEQDVKEFISVMEDSLKKHGSSLNINDIIKEAKHEFKL